MQPMAEARSSRTLVKGLNVLVCVGQSEPGGLRLVDLSTTMRVEKASLLRVLQALSQEHFTRRDRNGRWHLDYMVIDLAGRFIESSDVRGAALPSMERLSRELDETVHLGRLWDDGSVLYLEKVEGTRTIRMHSRIGARMPAHCSALGKALLAFDPTLYSSIRPQAVFAARTGRTISNGAELLQQLSITRARGYALDDMENEDGVRCLAAPISDHSDSVVAAISVSAPSFRLTKERIRSAAPLVIYAAHEISQRLGALDSTVSTLMSKSRQIHNPQEAMTK